ncbi:MAG: type II toxin-antitoxin system VapC family toxin [archaeon]|nr:type II toxin-antitoxin system VapC family toxin [archaeon]
MVLLDSDILISALRNDKNAVQFLANLQQSDQKLSTTVINVFELLEGAFLHHNPIKSIEKVEGFLTSFDILGFSPYMARTTARISAELKKKGEMLDFQDIAIASIAILNNEKIITRNDKHFSRIKELKIEKW